MINLLAEPTTQVTTKLTNQLSKPNEFHGEEFFLRNKMVFQIAKEFHVFYERQSSSSQGSASIHTFT